MNKHFGPKEYLETLKQTENLIAVAYPWELIDKIYGDSPLTRALIQSLKNKKPDRKSYCEPIFNDLVSGLSSAMQHQILEQVAIGELLLRDVNATLRKAEGQYSGFVIIVNRGLTTFFYTLTKLILARVGTFPEWERFEQPVLRPVIEFDQVVSLVHQLVKLYHEGKIPELPLEETALKDERLYLLASLQWYAVSFVVAHELGHYLNRHLDRTHSRDQEFSADETGFIVLLNCIYRKRDDIEIMKAIAGVVLALHYIEVLETTSGSRSYNHPPGARRIDRLRERFNFPGIYYNMADSFVSVSRDILKRLR